MNAASVKTGIRKISRIMAENKDYLIKLDQQNGDGDLGVSRARDLRRRPCLLKARLRRTWARY